MTRRFLSRNLPLATILMAAGLGLWTFGRWQQRSAETYKHLLTMAAHAPLDEWGALEEELRYAGQLPVISEVDRSVRGQRAMSQYWSGHYDGLLTGASAPGGPAATDEAFLLLAANAAYRRAAVDDASPAAVQVMEGLLSRYADLLRRGTWRFDSAYNYEFVARRRDALIRARSRRSEQKAGAEAAATVPPHTIHGVAGAVPPGVDMREFKIVVPQRSDERRQQPEGGTGGPKPRRG